MGVHVSYKGKDIGGVKINYSLRKIIFVANWLDCLKTLLGLGPTEVADVEGEGEIPYSNFRQKYLERVDAFYPIVETWACRSTKGTPREITMDLARWLFQKRQ